jgi:hypothetical protein
MTTFFPDGMAEIYALKIEPEEIIYVVKEIARLRDEGKGPDWYTMLFVLKERYEVEDMQVRMAKMFCISERMGCLVEITKDGRMRGWSIQAIEKECLLTNDAVFKRRGLMYFEA